MNTLLMLVALLGQEATVTPNSVVMGQGGIVTISGAWAKQPSVSMDNKQLPVTEFIEGESIKVRITNRQFYPGPKRFVIEELRANTKITDDGDAEYSRIGTWTDSPTGHQGDQDYPTNGAGTGANTATWLFTIQPGSYSIYTTWTSFSNRATNAKYKINDGTNLLGTVEINQKLEPSSLSANGVRWQLLGDFNLINTNLSVGLTDDADGYIIADAILVVPSGESPVDVTRIDGKFRVNQLKPYGTEVIDFDFENATQFQFDPLPRGWTDNTGNMLLENMITNPKTEIINDPTHGSPLSIRQVMIGQANQTLHMRTGFEYQELDGLMLTGQVPNRSAVGMNRTRYDRKIQSGAWTAANNIGTHHTGFPYVSYEINNRHDYCFSIQSHDSNGEWHTIYDPLWSGGQRGIGQTWAPGIAHHNPVAGRFNGGGSEFFPVEYTSWNSNKPLTIGMFDDLCRHYLSTEPGPGHEGKFVWWDNIGFASVNEFIESTPNWAFVDTATPYSFHVFPFSLTNTHPTESRRWHVMYNPTSLHGSEFSTFVGEGLFLDVNENGSYDAGIDVNVPAHPFTPGAQFIGPIAPGETLYMLARVQASGFVGRWRSGMISTIEESNAADKPVNQRMWRVMSTNHSTSFTTTQAIASETIDDLNSYPGWVFTVNTVASAPASNPVIPANVSALEVEGDTWITWDQDPRAVTGKLQRFEIEKDGNYYNSVVAASPGLIDTGLIGGEYRVRSWDVYGVASDWSVAVSSGSQPPPVDPPPTLPITVTITITDDDEPVPPTPPVLPTCSISADPLSIVETGGVSVITLTLSEVTTVPTEITLSLSGTATNTEYQISSLIVNIPAGQLTGTVNLTSVDDNVDEPNETVIVTITNTRLITS